MEVFFELEVEEVVGRVGSRKVEVVVVVVVMAEVVVVVVVVEGKMEVEVKMAGEGGVQPWMLNLKVEVVD